MKTMINWYDNIPAPVDKNGDVVPLGTEKLVYEGETYGVRSIAFVHMNKVWTASLYGMPEGRMLSDFALPDSWERLERDAVKAPCEYFGFEDDYDSSDCPDCPAHNRGCVDWMSLDLVRRAKALAGVR